LEGVAAGDAGSPILEEVGAHGEAHVEASAALGLRAGEDVVAPGHLAEEEGPGSAAVGE